MACCSDSQADWPYWRYAWRAQVGRAWCNISIIHLVLLITSLGSISTVMLVVEMTSPRSLVSRAEILLPYSCGINHLSFVSDFCRLPTFTLCSTFCLACGTSLHLQRQGLSTLYFLSGLVTSFSLWSNLSLPPSHEDSCDHIGPS